MNNKEERVKVTNLHASNVMLAQEKSKPFRAFNVQFEVCQDLEQVFDKEKNEILENNIFKEIGLAIEKAFRELNDDYEEVLDCHEKFNIKFEKVFPKSKFGWFKLK